MGSVYDLENLGLQSHTATTETWRFSYSIDTSGFTGAASDYISSVAAKVTSSVLGGTLISGPSGTGVWSTAANTNVTNSGCSGSGSGWLCFSSNETKGFAMVKNPNPYVWEFDVTMATGSLLSTASIQANYDPPNGLIMSESVAMTEGMATELSLSIIGLGGLFLWHKRSALRSIA
jgi:hypothetical protein